MLTKTLPVRVPLIVLATKYLLIKNKTVGIFIRIGFPVGEVIIFVNWNIIVNESVLILSIGGSQGRCFHYVN